MFSVCTLSLALLLGASKANTAKLDHLIAHGPDAATVLIPQQLASSSGHTNYFETLLQLALDHHSEGEKPLKVAQIDFYLAQARMIRALRLGEDLDVFWTMTTTERETQMQPIRIPLLKGLLGHRVFLIRADRQADFAKIETVEQLASLTAGQGTDWPDTAILRANNLKVITTTKFEQLFLMLRGKRFDYFPRGINEAWLELERHQGEDLAIEETIVLSYPAPMYFYVKNGNAELAARIEQGLETMIDDGCFDAHFNSHPSTRDAIARSNIKNRKTFKLPNPNLPSETPIDNPRYWLTLD